MVGPVEIFALLFIVFVILGPKRIVNMAKSLGKGATDFVGSIGDPNPDPDKTDKNKDLGGDGGSDDAPRRELSSGSSNSSDEKRKKRGRG